MHTERFESITSMLLSCELAMAIPGVPAPAVEKIRLIDNLARDMRGGWGGLIQLLPNFVCGKFMAKVHGNGLWQNPMALPRLTVSHSK
jgi:hypothetical protein